MNKYSNYPIVTLLKKAILLTTLGVLSACNLPLGSLAPTNAPTLVFPTAISSATPQFVTATISPGAPTVQNTAVSPTVTGTPTVTSIPFPTATPLPPTAPPTPVQPTPALRNIVPIPARIIFDPGATSGVVGDTIKPGQVQNYLVGASQNQPLIISISSVNNDVTFAVIGVFDGKPLVRQSDKAQTWQTMLIISQDYLIQVIPGSGIEKYSLQITTPARIYFDPGAISAIRSGSTPNGYTVSYVLRALAGQKLDLSLSAPAGEAVLAMYGYQDGNPYLRYVVEQTTFSLKLPTTEDYIIQVVPRAGIQTTYTLNITIK